MKRRTGLFLFLVSMFVMANVVISNRGIIEEQTFDMMNILALSQANAEETGGGPVDCESCWLSCWSGCVTKYRCNTITPCYKIQAAYKCSNSESSDCHP